MVCWNFTVTPALVQIESGRFFGGLQLTDPFAVEEHVCAARVCLG